MAKPHNEKGNTKLFEIKLESVDKTVKKAAASAEKTMKKAAGAVKNSGSSSSGSGQNHSGGGGAYKNASTSPSGTTSGGGGAHKSASTSSLGAPSGGGTCKSASTSPWSTTSGGGGAYRSASTSPKPTTATGLRSSGPSHHSGPSHSAGPSRSYSSSNPPNPPPVSKASPNFKVASGKKWVPKQVSTTSSSPASSSSSSSSSSGLPPRPPKSPALTNSYRNGTSSHGAPAVSPSVVSPGSPSQSSSSDRNYLKSSGQGLSKEVNKSIQCATGRVTNLVHTANNDKFDQDPAVVMAQWNIPPRKLLDRSFLSGVREGNEVLRLQNITLHRITKRHKAVMASRCTLTAHRTNYERIAIFKFSGGCNLRFVSDCVDKPCLRPYRFHYVLSDENYNLYMVELPRDSTEENLDMLEMMFTFYSYFHRKHGVKPGEETKVKGGTATKPLDMLANGLESGSHKVAEVCVSAGAGIAKGAHKVSESYQTKAKPFQGDHEAERQKVEKLKEKKDDTEKQVQKTSEGFAKGSDAVVNGMKDGFKYVGQRAKKGANAASKPVKDTDWYKKREEKAEKKKKEEEAAGVQTAPGVGTATVGVFKAGWNGFKTVKDGVGQGICTGAAGIRDAKVEATRYTDGDYAAEKSERRFNTAGHAIVGVFNVMTIFKTVGTIWASGAVWAAGGAINYDIDKTELLGGAPWKEGWLLWRNGIYAGGGYDLHWAVLRQHTFAMYAKPNDPKPKKYFKLQGFRSIDKCDYTLALKNHAFSITRSQMQYFSTEHLGPDAQRQCEIWMDLLWSLSEFHVPLRVLKKEKKPK